MCKKRRSPYEAVCFSLQSGPKHLYFIKLALKPLKTSETGSHSATGDLDGFVLFTQTHATAISDRQLATSPHPFFSLWMFGFQIFSLEHRALPTQPLTLVHREMRNRRIDSNARWKDTNWNGLTPMASQSVRNVGQFPFIYTCFTCYRFVCHIVLLCTPFNFIYVRGLPYIRVSGRAAVSSVTTTHTGDRIKKILKLRPHHEGYFNEPNVFQRAKDT